MSKLIPIDFEYKSFQNDKFLRPICVAIGDNVYWLLDEIQKNNFIEYMKSIEGNTLISHASSLAEIPCCLQLGIDVEKYLWFDTMVMQKRLDVGLRHNDKADRKKDYSLLDCLEVNGIKHKVSETQKNDYRKIIIETPIEGLDKYKFEILEYCSSDIEDLKLLAERQTKEFQRLINGKTLIDVMTSCPYNGDIKTLFHRMLEQQSICNITTAKMYCSPFQADFSKIDKMSDLRFKMQIMEEMNKFVEGYFKPNGIRNDNALREYIFKTFNDAQHWFEDRGYITKAKGQISLSTNYLDEFMKEHKGIDDKFDVFRQLGKCLKACNGFSWNNGVHWVYSNKADDGLHCNACEFGTKTSRYAPKPSGAWIPGMGKALRGLLKPNDKNEAYFSLDFNAQEIFVIGQLAKDINLLEAYSSNDIYMSIAKQMGMYPKDLKIPTEAERSEEWFKPYKQIRKKMKSLVLGLNYGMSPKSMAERMKIDETEAIDLIDKFNKTFKNKFLWSSNVSSYLCDKDKHYILMTEKDVCLKSYNYKENFNRNKRQAMNFPVQSLGASITREALRLAFERGLKPIFPVHDEIYFRTTKDKLDKDVATARQCMIEAAFNALGDACIKDYSIKVGNAEVTTSDNVPIHEGAEDTVEKINLMMLRLDTLPPTYKPFAMKEKKVEKVKEQPKLEGFFDV